jgi:hypothetical protein
MKELMLDIETLGNTPGSIVFEVGAVLFDEKGVLDTFHAFMPVAASAHRGFTIALPTLSWRADNGRSLNDIITMSGLEGSINDTMLRLAKFMDGVEQFWSKGNFDYPLMARYFDSCNLNTPWKYGQVRELRTMLSEFGIVTPKADISHNALEDALQQVELLLKMRGMVGGNPKRDEIREKGLDLLRQLVDLQNGPPLARYEDEWVTVVADVHEFLKQHEV